MDFAVIRNQFKRFRKHNILKKIKVIKWEHVKKIVVDSKRPDLEKDGNGKRRK